MRHLRTIVAVIALASVVALVGCGGAPSTPAGGTGGTGGSGASAVSVSLKNMAFDPAVIDVAVGGTVTFTNNDSVDHTVTGASFDSGPLAPGATFSQTFATAGTFPIRCTIHPSMTASVNVK